MIAHEIGHVLGFRHIRIKGNPYNLMNESTPTYWIANELALYPEQFSELLGLYRDSHWNLFKKPILMAYEMRDGFSEFNFLFRPKLNKLNNSNDFQDAPAPPGDRYHIRSKPPYDYNRESFLSITKFDPTIGDFKDVAYFEMKNERVCSTNFVGPVSMAHYPENVPYTSITNDKPFNFHNGLFDLADKFICGEMVSESGVSYEFRFILSYSGPAYLHIGKKAGVPAELKNYFWSNGTYKDFALKNTIVFPASTRSFYLEKPFGEPL